MLKTPFVGCARCLSYSEPGGTVMTTLQAMWLGALLAWTPSILLLAWLLREPPLDERDELHRDPS
jgi:hypothetical protein